MKFSSAVKKNAAKVAGFVIVMLGFARGESNRFMTCPDFPCTLLQNSDLTYNYFLDDFSMISDPYNTVCHSDNALVHVHWSAKTWNHYTQAEHLFSLREEELLSHPWYNSTTSPGLRSARNFYDHCVNLNSETPDEEVKSKSILVETISANPSGRKPLNYAPDPKYDLPDVNNTWINLDNYYVKHFGLSTFHHITRTMNQTENKIVLVLAPPKLLIPTKVLLSLGPAVKRKEHFQMAGVKRSPERQAYVDYIHQSLQNVSSVYKRNRFIGSEEQQINTIEELIDFEVNLAKIAQPHVNEIYVDDMSSLPTFDDWQDWYNKEWMYHDVSVDVKWQKSPILYLARGLVAENAPCMIDWTNRIYSLVRSVVTPEESSLTDLTLNAARVDMNNAMYHMRLCPLLRTTKREVVTNYINWNNYRNGIVRTKEGYESFIALEIKMKFHQHISKPRATYCTETNVLKTPVHWALTYEAKSYIAPMKEQIRTIYKNVLASLLDTRANRFLSDKSKLAKKLSNNFFSMPINIFGDERWFAQSGDPGTDIPEVPKVSNFFGWYIEQQKWQIKNALRLIDEPSNKLSWPIGSDRALVYVTKTENNHEMYLPGAILQPPFFSPTGNELLNYAGIGVEIASVLWDLVVFPAIKEEVVLNGVNSIQANCPSALHSVVTNELYNEVYKNVHRSVDAVEIALNAFTQAAYVSDDGKYAQTLQPSQKKVFIAAHVKNQCERYRNYNPMSNDGAKEIRPVGVYYPFREFSTSPHNANALRMSRFFIETYNIELRCNGAI